MKNGYPRQPRLLKKIAVRLETEYHTPDLGNVEDVFGELIFALLSTRTDPKNYRRVYAALRARFPRWPDLLNARPNEIRKMVRPCGLYRRKTSAIVQIARRVFVEDGFHDLEHLRDFSTESAQKYLCSLPEVGAKIAKCVCLYALRRPSFPLDSHNLRVLIRVGILPADTDARRRAEQVESMVPPRIRHSLHVNLIAHGRAICAARPKCDRCSLSDVCASFPLLARAI